MDGTKIRASFLPNPFQRSVVRFYFLNIYIQIIQAFGNNSANSANFCPPSKEFCLLREEMIQLLGDGLAISIYCP